MPASRRTLTSSLLLAVALLLRPPFAASADELPRWKFSPGEQLAWQVVQTTKVDIAAGDAGETSSEAQQTIDLVWKVDRVDDDGTMHGTVQFPRIQVHIAQPSGLTLEYDSQADEGAEALSAMLLPLFETLLEAEVPLAISARGEVTKCELTEDEQRRLAGIPATRAMSDLVSENGVRKLVELVALPLPAEGEESSKRPLELANRVLGTLTGEIGWSLAASEGDEAERDIQHLTPSVELSVAPADPPGEDEYGQPQPLTSPTVEAQQITGQAKFDRAAGRLIESTRTTRLTITGRTMGAQTETRVEQTVAVTRR